MARLNRLTALKIEKAKVPGLLCDGGGLYLQITKGADGGSNKSWLFRYSAGKQGRTRMLGLGPTHTITLAEAREKARQARHLLLDGIDPIEHRRAARAQANLDAAKAITFRECADTYIAAHRSGWRNAKHAAQWETTLTTYAYPVIGALPVQAIDTALVMKVIEPLWRTRTETASRLRGRIEAVLDWATTREYRAGENPARWKGHLANLLPARSKAQQVKHHEALNYAELPAFMAVLREREDIAARALEFTILTAARVGEVLGAQWSEFNLLDKVWTVPATRMKAGKEHRVPLSDAALAVLERLQAHRTSDDAYVFPGRNAPVGDWSVLAVLKSTSGGEATVHGFRSTFRDWADERTHYSNHVVERALAHAIGSKVERAYRRTDLFEQRRRLMSMWAEFCGGTPVERGEVAVLRAAHSAGQ
jgi:integrase